MEAEIGVMHLQTRDPQITRLTGSKEKGVEQILPQSFQKEPNLGLRGKNKNKKQPNLPTAGFWIFGLLNWREYISVVFTQFTVLCYGSPRKQVYPSKQRLCRLTVYCKR